ncbi:uncharacterized protein LOC143880311 isoform X2 [Tasmannia lanceolata]|uniref:uncharacterized protein LOC143880311 isoform X2 n=1 Tax=Tasmannia lanceolata TaxID=3420 RepID=UPI0040634F1B
MPCLPSCHSDGNNNQYKEFSSSWEIRATPFFFLKDGQQVDKLVSANKPELEKKRCCWKLRCFQLLSEFASSTYLLIPSLCLPSLNRTPTPSNQAVHMPHHELRQGL